MNIVQDIQKLVYTFVSNNKQHIKVYSCSNKDIKFPYIILELEKIKSEENFTNKKYEISINIKIFDKNETNTQIIEISNELRENITKLSNTKIRDSIIIDIINENNSLEMHNGLNSIWSDNLKFKFIINKLKEIIE